MTARTGPAVVQVSASAAQALAACFSQGWVMGRLGGPPVWRLLLPPANDSRPADPHTRRSHTSLACSVSTLARARPTRSAVNANNQRTGERRGAAATASATLPAVHRRSCSTAPRSTGGITRRPSASDA
jgi:hypothetical protein